MIQLHRGLDVARSKLLFQADRLERLACDLRRAAAGGWPAAADLEAAPFMDTWRLGTVEIPTLVGMGSSHPRLGDTDITTTEIWAVDLNARWARTLSRLYRLGERLDKADRHD